jgi:hypothetical protein
MPFQCKICDLEILPGAPMVSNAREELAHEACVKNARPIIPHLQVVSSVIQKPVAPLPPAADTCVPSRPPVCVECGDPCIGMCPICLKHRCQAYGWNGKTCGIAHEGKCPGAKELREPLPKTPKPLAIRPGPIYDTIPIVDVPLNGNGKHKSKAPKKKARR